jgi:hypothetical protein
MEKEKTGYGTTNNGNTARIVFKIRIQNDGRNYRVKLGFN